MVTKNTSLFLNDTGNSINKPTNLLVYHIAKENQHFYIFQDIIQDEAKEVLWSEELYNTELIKHQQFKALDELVIVTTCITTVEKVTLKIQEALQQTDQRQSCQELERTVDVQISEYCKQTHFTKNTLRVPIEVCFFIYVTVDADGKKKS